LQILAPGWRPSGQQHAARQRDERLGLVHLRVQPGAGDRGERAVAAVRAFRRRAERQGDPRPADQQVQGLRLCHHDQLRRGRGRHSVAQRLHPRQPGAAGLLQDQQEQNGISGADCFTPAPHPPNPPPLLSPAAVTLSPPLCLSLSTTTTRKKENNTIIK
jgi:hypothetical protein